MTYCKTFLAGMLFTACATTASAQDAGTEWINENAYALYADTARSTADLQFLSTELKNRTVVGLGEASHGTKEFYDQKRRIIEYLVTRLGFRSLGFEFSESFIGPLNQYVINGTGDLKALMQPMVLYNTEEIYRLFQFIRSYNAGQPAGGKVSVYGFDKEEYAADPFNRDRFMARNVISGQTSRPAKTILWAHNLHIAKDTTMAQFPAMGYHLRKHYGDKLYVIGFETFRGSVSVITENGIEKRDFETEKGSFAEIFAKAAHPVIFVPFNKGPNPFTGVRKNITNIYANWTDVRALPVIAGKDFDAMLFIKTTTASAILANPGSPRER